MVAESGDGEMQIELLMDAPGEVVWKHLQSQGLASSSGRGGEGEERTTKKQGRPL